MPTNSSPTTVNIAIVPQGRWALTLTGVTGRRPDLPPLAAGRLPPLTKADLEPLDADLEPLDLVALPRAVFLAAARFVVPEPERLGFRDGWSESLSVSASSRSSTSSDCSSSSGFVFLVMDFPRSGLGCWVRLHPKLCPGLSPMVSPGGREDGIPPSHRLYPR